ncbi:MAG TPA: TolC family protein [Ohtaekwangia sp.]
MKKFYQTLIVVALVLPTGVFAQSGQTSFSLDDCIRYALENTIAIKDAKVDEQISESKVKETVGIGLPQIDGGVTLQHNIKQARFFTEYQPSAEGGFIDLSGIPGIQPGDVVALPQFFQLPSSGTASVNVNQLLFNSSYLVGLKAASAYKDLAYKNTEQTQITVIENVAKAYYAVLVNNERIALFDNNIARVDSLLRTTTAMNQNGFSEDIDVSRIQVQLNNLKSERLIFINSQLLSVGLLKFQMNYPMDQPLTVTGSLDSLKVREDLFQEYEAGWDYKNLVEYRRLEVQKRLQELNIKNQYSHSMPSLSAFATLGYSTQSPNIGGLFTTESGVESTSQYGPDKWYSFSYVGVSLNVPIFSGLQRSQRIQQEKLALNKIQNNFTSFKQQVDLSIEQNTTTYKNALESVKSQRENMDLATKVARVTKIKYEQGVGSNIEVTDAENSLRAAQVNYYNALYDAIVSRIDLDRAYGKIVPAEYTTTK